MRSRYVDAHVEIEWFSYDFNKRARAEHLQHFALKHRWVSKAFMLNCLQYYCVWCGFDIFARVDFVGLLERIMKIAFYVCTNVRGAKARAQF